jgi:hypothetical protein
MWDKCLAERAIVVDFSRKFVCDPRNARRCSVLCRKDDAVPAAKTPKDSRVPMSRPHGTGTLSNWQKISVVNAGEPSP